MESGQAELAPVRLETAPTGPGGDAGRLENEPTGLD